MFSFCILVGQASHDDPLTFSQNTFVLLPKGRWCGHPDDDRRLSESVSVAQELVQSEEFQKFEDALCGAIIKQGEYHGAAGCRVAISNCEEGSGASASAVQSYLVKDMRAAPQDGVVFVLENGN
jgi:hypothetical protein